MNLNNIFFCLLTFCSSLQSVSLNKAFFHKGNLQDKIVFYFDDIPKIDLQLQKKSNKELEQMFLFSNVRVTPEADQSITNINKTRNNFYKLKIIKKQNGFELVIMYDKNKVSNLQVYSFSAITSSKGVVINIFHTSDIKKSSKNKNIIIDMGHGGKDKGAVGYSGSLEKDITYKVGMILFNLLKKQGFNVFLTRSKDDFVPLDQRTSFANFIPGDSIFISIHVNHSNNNAVTGLETYYTDSSLFNKINFNLDADKKNESYNLKKDEQSKFLADTLHGRLINDLKKVNLNIVDRKVKRSVSQVLLGTEMPSVLIELGFISNKDEELLLNRSDYIEAIAESMCNNIMAVV